MKKKNNLLDEMQEQKMLKIEHNGCWFAFWGLLAVIMIQTTLGGEHVIREVAGEWTIFMLLCFYLFGACMKNGIWDRRLKPNFKNSLLLSILGGGIIGVSFFVKSYVSYHKLAGSIGAAVVGFGITFVLCMAAYSISAAAYKKRLDKLEGENGEEQGHE